MKPQTKNNIATFGFVLIVCSLIFAGTYYSVIKNMPQQADDGFADGQSIMTQSEIPLPFDPIAVHSYQTQAGAFLSALFAQRHHDWDRAHDYLQQTIMHDDQDLLLLRRSMISAIAAGDYQTGFDTAQNLYDREDKNPLAQILLSLQFIHDKDYDATLSMLEELERDAITDFFMPLVRAWAHAGNGDFEVSEMDKNIIYAYHAIAVAKMLERDEALSLMLDQSLRAGDLQTNDLERLADIFLVSGDTDKALTLYKDILQFTPQNRLLIGKIEKVEAGDVEHGNIAPPSTPQEGIALALYDTALLLYNEFSDDSAHIFSSLALYLNPDLEQATLLMAAVAARQEQYGHAIALYKKIPEDSPSYVEVRLEMADLYERDDRTDKAKKILADLAENQNVVAAYIQIGDMQRRDKNYEAAITSYNKAEDLLDGPISSDFWHIHYLRGMAYERAGQWEKAEKDLLAALEYRPNDPHILNYLGYSWADQGQNLDKALIMIRQAVRLRPQDGYITDSLGWVLYRMGQFEQALPHLERAVALLPYDPIINDHLGDAYWQVGRKREAKFQWERAKNHIKDGEEDDPDLLAKLQNKLKNGLDGIDNSVMMEAKNETADKPL